MFYLQVPLSLNANVVTPSPGLKFSNTITPNGYDDLKMIFSDVYASSGDNLAPRVPYVDDGSYYSEGGSLTSLSVFEGSWIDELYPSVAAQDTSVPCEPEYSAETATSSFQSSMLSYDPRDTCTYVGKSVRKRLPSPGEVNSLSEIVDQTKYCSPNKELVSIEVQLKASRYNPMNDYPCELLKKFSRWYSDAKNRRK